MSARLRYSAAGALAAFAFAAQAAPPALAPSFDLPGARLADLRGKVVYVDFWASWCGPCRKSFPWMNTLQQRHGPAGLQVVAINVDEKREDAAAFLAKVPASFTIAYDPAGVTPKAYGIKGMPSSALVGRDGQLLWMHSGFNEADKDKLEERIRAALQP
ncbi:TlpA family protein disulfide reductase [Pseudoduganella sp. OTU4001]|uniref:TlpA family protein disulfide reductase n=1 Tax=Pseudoduganella sp. OTU4001 TaxID=3043854 RepID=UPI00313BA17D